jgi:hypothetical protein
MSLKDFGWETYRVRAHSIPTSIANTDTYQSVERRMPKLPQLLSPNKCLSPTSNDIKLKREVNKSSTDRINQNRDFPLPELKSKRSLTMPSSFLLNSNEIPEIRTSK